jgi:hypothetical protein
MASKEEFQDSRSPITPDHETSSDQSDHVTPGIEAKVRPGEKTATKKVHNVALSEATAIQKPSLLTRRMFLVCPTEFDVTSDAANIHHSLRMSVRGNFQFLYQRLRRQLNGAINSYPQYRTYFGFPLDKGTPSTGIVYAIYTIGNLVGSFAAGPATDFRGTFSLNELKLQRTDTESIGRRYSMFIGGLVIILGTCVQASSKDLAAFMVGRFILGFGVAIYASAGPAYVSEMAHP